MMTEVTREQLDALAALLGDPNVLLSDFDTGYYWFECQRPDQTRLVLSLSIFERTVGVVVSFGETSVTMHFSRCGHVRILDGKFIEILPDAGSRTFIDPLGSPVLSFLDSNEEAGDSSWQ
jgi:hypothetical protein